MRLSDALRTVTNLELFEAWLSNKLIPDDPESYIETIEMVTDEYDGEYIALNWCSPASCECCTYNFWGSKLSPKDIDKLYNEFITHLLHDRNKKASG